MKYVSPKEDKTQFWDTIRSCSWVEKRRPQEVQWENLGCETRFGSHRTEERNRWSRRVTGIWKPVLYFRGNFILTLSYNPAGLHLICSSTVADSGHASDAGSQFSVQRMITAIFNRPPALVPSTVASPPPKTADMMGQPVSLLLCLIVSEGYTKTFPRLVWTQSGGTLWKTRVCW